MIRRCFIIALALSTLLVPPASPGAELLLQDGQVLSGIEVRREHDTYYLTREGGEVLTIPVGLVRELRLVEERKGPKPATPLAPPTGLREAEPEVLVGPPEPTEPPQPAEQLAVLGPAATFRPSVFDPWWYPSSDWTLDPRQNDFHPAHWAQSVLDPTWIPSSAFDAEVDVLAPSRSTWMPGVIAFEWWPSDSFAESLRIPSTTIPPVEPEVEPSAGPQDPRFVPGEPLVAQFTPAGRTTEPDGTVAAAACAREIFRALPGAAAPGVEPQVRALDDPALAPLGVSFYAASLQVRGRPYRAVFTTGPGVCRLVAGDLEPLLGLPVDERLAENHVARAVGQARADSGAPELDSDEEKIRYAYLVARLANFTAVAGGAEPRLISDRGELEQLAAQAPARCVLNARKRKQEVERALAAFTAPAVVDGEGGEVVVFQTWSPIAGELVRHAVRLEAGRLQTVERNRLAGHLGSHRDHETRR